MDMFEGCSALIDEVAELASIVGERYDFKENYVNDIRERYYALSRRFGYDETKSLAYALVVAVLDAYGFDYKFDSAEAGNDWESYLTA